MSSSTWKLSLIHISVPVWLVGTSRGTVSAASVGVRLGPSRVAGVVLTSTVWAGSIAQVPLEQLRVPTLLVHNHDDGCRESPFDYAPLGDVYKRQRG